MRIISYTPGPNLPSIPIKSVSNNGITTNSMGMPFKQMNMNQGSIFSNDRSMYFKSTKGQSWFGPTAYSVPPTVKPVITKKTGDSSEYIKLKKISSVGKSTTKQGLPPSAKLSYKNVNTHDVSSSLRRCRSSGSIVPKKCTAY